MAAGIPPWYLPGGFAMVPTVGGASRFAIDADECCCECPTPAWCDSHCSADYCATFRVFGCNVDITLARYAACLWRHDGAYCGHNWTFVLRCYAVNPYGPGVSWCGVFCPLWRFVATYAPGWAFTWVKPAGALVCPSGLYNAHEHIPPRVCYPGDLALWGTTDITVNIRAC